jgi:lambda repressor-like predicted transcriptional regulator
MNAELIDAGASMAYLNGLTGYEQTGRLQRPTLERMTARPASWPRGHDLLANFLAIPASK